MMAYLRRVVRHRELVVADRNQAHRIRMTTTDNRRLDSQLYGRRAGDFCPDLSCRYAGRAHQRAACGNMVVKLPEEVIP